MLLTPLARAYIFSVFAVLPAFVLGVSVFGPVMIIRRRRDEVWFERARYLFPFRKAVSLLFTLQLISGAILSGLIQNRLGLDGDRWFMPTSIAGLIVGSFYSLYLIHRRVGGECPTFATWLVEFGSISLLRLLFGLLAIGVGFLLAPYMSPALAWSAAWIIAYLVSVAGLSLWFLRVLRRLVSAPPELVSRANSIAKQLGIESPSEVLVLKLRSANAFAMPIIRKVVVTSRLLTELTPGEVDSILAHELGHLGEERADTIKRVLVGLTVIPAIYFAVFNIDNLPILIASLMVAFLILRFSSSLSQGLEKRADSIALKSQAEPGAYATALLKLYQVNLVPAVLRRKARRTHPDLYDRMVSAGAVPPFARPRPPVRSLFFIPCSFAVVVNAIVYSGFIIAVPEMPKPVAEDEYYIDDQIILDDQSEEFPPANRPSVPIKVTPI